MTNTLQDADKVIITNLAYTPKRGDIVVISRNADNSVESVKTGQVPIINGKRVGQFLLLYSACGGRWIYVRLCPTSGCTICWIAALCWASAR